MLVCLNTFIENKTFAQNQGLSCNDAIILPLPAQTCQRKNFDIATNEKWFSFVANSEKANLEIYKANIKPIAELRSVSIWDGNCPQVNKIFESIRQPNGNFPPLEIDGMIQGHKYFVKIEREQNFNGNFEICLKKQIKKMSPCSEFHIGIPDENGDLNLSYSSFYAVSGDQWCCKHFPSYPYFKVIDCPVVLDTFCVGESFPLKFIAHIMSPPLSNLYAVITFSNGDQYQLDDLYSSIDITLNTPGTLSFKVDIYEKGSNALWGAAVIEGMFIEVLPNSAPSCGCIIVNKNLGEFGTGPIIFIGNATFTGTYHVQSNLILKDGQFTLTPNTVFYMSYNTNITLYNAELFIADAKITAACDSMWYGIISSNFDSPGSSAANRINLSGSADSSEISYSLQGVKMHADLDKISINKTRFLNNHANITIKGVADNSSTLGVAYIQSNRFCSFSEQMLYPLNKINNFNQYYSAYGITLIGGASYGQQSTGIYIQNNKFQNLIRGIVTLEDVTLFVYNNTFENIFGASILAPEGTADFNSVSVISDNEFYLPASGFNTVQLNNGGKSYGVIFSGPIQITNNTFDRITPTSPTSHEGVVHERLLGSVNISGNNFFNLYKGISTSTVNAPGATIASNRFGGCIYGVYIPASNPYSVSDLQLSCNSFLHGYIFAAAPAPQYTGIYIESGGQLAPQGNCSNEPAGNRFTLPTSGSGSKGISEVRTIWYEVIPNPLSKYSCYDDEKEQLGAPNSNYLGINPDPCGRDAMPDDCPGYNGAGKRSQNNNSFNLDNAVTLLSNKRIDIDTGDLPTAEDNKNLADIIRHFHVNNECSQYLEQIANNMLKGGNKFAYNVLGWHLVDCYGLHKNLLKATHWQNELINKNPLNRDMVIRVKFNDVYNRLMHLTTGAEYSITLQDIGQLKSVAQSNTGYADLACYILMAYGLTDGNCNAAGVLKPMQKSNNVNGNLITDNSLLNIPQITNNFPNPFSEYTTISYSLPVAYQIAEIRIYNSYGQLIDAYNLANSYNSMLINASSYSNGIYYCDLFVDGVSYDHKKMVVIK